MENVIKCEIIRTGTVEKLHIEIERYRNKHMMNPKLILLDSISVEMLIKQSGHAIELIDRGDLKFENIKIQSIDCVEEFILCQAMDHSEVLSDTKEKMFELMNSRMRLSSLW